MLNFKTNGMSLCICPSPDELPDLSFLDHAPTITNDEIFTWFHHPLFVSMFPLASPEPIDQALRRRIAHSDRLRDAGKYHAYVFFFERGYRASMLLDLVHRGTWNPERKRDLAAYWSIARSVWVDAEFDEEDPIWTMIMDAMPRPELMTSVADRKRLKALPETFRVYKGMQVNHSATDDDIAEASALGWSWTLSRKTARFFADRFNEKGARQSIIASATIPKEAVTAYLTGRGEAEILIPPGTIEANDWKRIS